MKKSDIGLAVIFIALGAGLTIASSVIIQANMATSVPAKVIAENSYMGQDNTPFYNLTVSYGSVHQNYIVPCSYYKIGSSFPLKYYPQVLFLPSFYGIDGSLSLEVGCQ